MAEERRETLLGILFVLAVLGVLGLAAAGIITSPLAAGVLVIAAVVLAYFGRFVTRLGVPGWMWFLFCVGLMLVFYGLIQKGYLPLAAGYGTPAEEAVATSLLYVLVAAAVLAIAFAAYALLRRPAPLTTRGVRRW